MDNPRVVHGNAIPMGIPWETSYGMSRDGTGINCYGNVTDKYVQWTTLEMSLRKKNGCRLRRYVVNLLCNGSLISAVTGSFGRCHPYYLFCSNYCGAMTMSWGIY